MRGEICLKLDDQRKTSEEVTFLAQRAGEIRAIVCPFKKRHSKRELQSF